MGSGAGMANGTFSEPKEGADAIAARQRVQVEISKATALLEAIGQISSDPIYAKDIDGRFFYANPAILAVIGKSADSVLGHTDLEFHSDPDLAAIVMANDQRIMQAGIPHVIEETWDAAGLCTRTYKSTRRPFTVVTTGIVDRPCLPVDRHHQT